MALTDSRIRTLKPGDKLFRIADSRGLALEVRSNGAKYWRFRYRFGGKANMLALGSYPEVGLADARERRDEARKLLAAGIDPSARRKAEKAAMVSRTDNSLELVALEWHLKYRSTWTPEHADRLLRRLESKVFPFLGRSPVADITAPMVLDVARRVEQSGALDTAHRVISCVGQVMRYAIATGRAERDPTPDLRGALPAARQKHFAAITEPAEVGSLLRALDGYQGTAVTRAALRLAPLVFTRPVELRTMRWEHVDLEAAEWRFLVTKTRTPHVVPLAHQAVAILRELHALTGRAEFAFPGVRTPRRPMSENTVLFALRGLGYGPERMTGHGFRAMARTILDEVLGFRVDLIEHQLAHAVKDVNGRAYNRVTLLPERKKMMQRWADYLDSLRSAASTKAGGSSDRTPN